MRKGKGEDIRQNGFSLIELMIVVAIIGILVAIIIPNLLDAVQRARQRATVGEIRSWGTALAAYEVERSSLPPPSGPLASGIYNSLVPYAVSTLHTNDKWGFPLRYTAFPAGVPTTYTVLSYGDNNINDVCITPATWFNYEEDISISNGVFSCVPI